MSSYNHASLIFVSLVLMMTGTGTLWGQVPDSTGVSPPESVEIGLSKAELLKPGISATRAVLMTPVFPGWGQLYARNNWRAAVGFGVEMFYLSQLLLNNRKAVRNQEFADQLPPDSAEQELYNARAEENRQRALDFIWWSAGVLLIVALDAYVGAHLFEFDEDAVPVPNRWDKLSEVASSGPFAPDSGPTLLLFQWRISF